MIIVAGALHLEPDNREAYLADCRDLISQARGTAGCLDFHLAADPSSRTGSMSSSSGRSVAAVEAFRGSGPSGPQQDAIRSASVWQHEIGSSKEL